MPLVQFTEDLPPVGVIGVMTVPSCGKLTLTVVVSRLEQGKKNWPFVNRR
jgi:hypothetical protein